MIFWTRLALFLVFAAIAILLAWMQAARAGDAMVRITNFTFDPPVLRVKAGTAVTWTNEDDIPHTVAAAERAFRSKALDTGDKYTFTFAAPGAYKYFCSLHPHMTATILVEGAAGAM
ncbi:MAG: cupredoxin family copper-binding protein [Methylocapsa sp.]|nr:cupredoxin family copper-binding protein [Methylocapsa sp.]